jgi:hypothetical protein
MIFVLVRCDVQILTGKCFVSAIAQVFEEEKTRNKTDDNFLHGVHIEKETFTFDLHTFFTAKEEEE